MRRAVADSMPDPWSVVDLLAERGKPAAAASFADAAPAGLTKLLADYAKSVNPGGAPAAGRQLLRDASSMIEDGRPEDALRVLVGIDAKGDGVLEYRVAVRRASASRALARLGEAALAGDAAAAASLRVGWGDGAVSALRGAIVDAVHAGDTFSAVDRLRRLRSLFEKAADAEAVAGVESDLGTVARESGDAIEAFAHLEKAALRLRRSPDLAAKGHFLNEMALVHLALGRLVEALRDAEGAQESSGRAGRPDLEADALVTLGAVREALGQPEDALTLYERARTLYDDGGDAEGRFKAMGNIGNVHIELGEYDEALAWIERARADAEAANDPATVARLLGNACDVRIDQGRYTEALPALAKALEAARAVGDRENEALTFGSFSRAFRGLGFLEEAYAYSLRAVEAAERLGAREMLVVELRGLAELCARVGAPATAVAHARRAVSEMQRLVRGLAEGEGALARSRQADVFEVGALAARRMRDIPTLAYFLEAGRAGALLESLGGREALRDVRVPDELARARHDALLAEASATAKYRAVLDEPDRSVTTPLHEAMVAAEERVAETTERIQREARTAASVAYPQPATLEAIEASLKPEEALVLYALGSEEALVLVVRRGAADVVELGATADVVQDCEGLRVAEGHEVPTTAIDSLAARVVAPLHLDASVQRVLVSPDGALSYVPFALLLPGREIAWEPSGTAYGALLADRASHGSEVLALGDPEYGTKSDATAESVLRGGIRLDRLAATRDEATAVGNVVLVGADASETRFRAEVASRKGWRAVHLACHGLVNPDRPTLSSLALAGTAEDDGFLTALDVFQMSIPADLAVLSACQTGKGRVVRGEGIVGLTRAFMFAGAPRVIVSLWKVEDKATGALMRRFYELWNGPDPAKRVHAAAALAAAQHYVKSQPGWEHPFYWAGWALWGLPE